MTTRIFGEVYEPSKGTTDLFAGRSIGGLSIPNFGDSLTRNTARTINAVGQNELGYDYDSGDGVDRVFTLIKLNIDVSRILGHRIIQAYLRVAVRGVEFGSALADFPPGGAVFSLHEVRAPGNVRPTLADITDATWQYYDATGSLAWTLRGGQIGTDVTAALTTATFTLEQAQAGPTSADPQWLVFDITDLMQSAAVRGYQPMVMLRGTWAIPTGHIEQIVINDASTLSSVPHTYGYILSTPPVTINEPRDDDETRPDLAKYKDPDVIGGEVEVGYAQPGSVGSWKPLFITNNADVADQPRNWVIGPQAFAGPVTQASATERLKRVKPMQNTGSTRCFTGILRLTATSTSAYEAHAMLRGTSSWVALATSTGAATANFAADTIWRYPSSTDHAFTIDEDAWDFDDAAEAADVWYCNLFADTRLTSEDELAPTMIEVAPFYGSFDPAIADDEATAWTAYRNPLSTMWVQQAWAAPENAVWAVVDGGDDASHGKLYVRDASVEGCEVGRRITIQTPDEYTAGALKVEHHVIAGVIPAAANGGGDIVWLVDELAEDYDETAVHGTGVYGGLLTAPTRARTAADADAGDGAFTTTTVFDAASGQVDLYNVPDSEDPTEEPGGETERHTFTRSGTTIDITGTLASDFRQGTQLQLVETGYYEKFYCRFAPPLGSDRGEVRTRLRRISAEVVA